MKKLSNYEINEALNCLYEVLNRMEHDYFHINNVINHEIKAIEKKIAKLYKELEKREN